LRPAGRRALVLLGSNLRPSVHMPAALRALGSRLRVVRASPWFESDAVGDAGGPRFWNAAVVVRDAPPPAALGTILRGLEASLGRTRGTDRNSPRTLDLDLLATARSGRVDRWPGPHGDLLLFHHAAVPAAAVAPAWRLPTGRSLAAGAAALGPPPPGFRVAGRPRRAARPGKLAGVLPGDPPVLERAP
jgi:2-amino-4-hydroxy-6-hydroxymethyldihydropteridine diphosphokinase